MTWEVEDFERGMFGDICDSNDARLTSVKTAKRRKSRRGGRTVECWLVVRSVLDSGN